jgi:glucose-1-phosphate cytidylyltransferase
MKAVILAGGRGTRIAEESTLRPKPMITIGGSPILWHILRIYSAYGINDFVICLGHKGYMIKEYFANYVLHNAQCVEINLEDGNLHVRDSDPEPWRITLVETGDDTQTGGRIKRIHEWVRDDEAFCLTYGDGLADIDIGRLVEFHKSHGHLATITTVEPPGRFGAVEMIEGDRVARFTEKPSTGGEVINGGFFVLSPKVIEYIDGDETVWERTPLEKLSAAGELHAYRHKGFWQAMDTIREREKLEELWASGKAPWVV